MTRKLFARVLTCLFAVLTISFGQGYELVTAASVDTKKEISSYLGVMSDASMNILPGIYMTKEYTLCCGSLESQRFYGDVAWTGLKAQETDEKAVGLINRRGEVIYINENGESPTPFINDLSAVYTDTGFVIVNTAGQEVYICTDERMTLLGQADDGTFIIEKHETGFDVNTRTYCVLNSSLELEDTGIERIRNKNIITGTLMGTDINKIICIADGTYLIDTEDYSEILNLNKQSSYIETFMGLGDVGDDGKYVYMYMSGTYSLVPVSILSQATSLDELVEMCSNSDSCVPVNFDIIHYGVFKSWHGGTFYDDGTYYDVYGNVLMSMPEFPKGVSYQSVTNFSGGYAALILTGADGGDYVTVVDENGNIQYDPIAYPGRFATYKGYIFSLDDDNVEIIDPTGEHKNLGDDLSDLAGGEYYTSIWAGEFICIGGDFIYTPSKFVSVDGSITIETATANYSENGELIYTDENGNYVVNDYSAIDVDSTGIDSSDSYTENSQTFTKYYIIAPNFSIEGKWKNVGEYTFGQAQAGAIVVFDGENCNFFSPQDTYAFYKDGDNYKLDCTSLLADSLSFTVKIIDDNNIDIYNGSNYLEMTRVN